MSFKTAIVVASLILSAAGIALLVLTGSRKRQAKEEELKRAASMRGSVYELDATDRASAPQGAQQLVDCSHRSA